MANGFALLILALLLAAASSQGQRHQDTVNHEQEPSQHFHLGENGHREVEKQAFKKAYRMGDDDFTMEDGDYIKREDGDYRMEDGDYRMEDGDYRTEDGDYRTEDGDYRMEGDYRFELENDYRSEGDDNFQGEGNDDFLGEVKKSNYLFRELANVQKEAHTKPPKSPKKVTFEENTDMQALVERIVQSEDDTESFEGEDSDALNQWVMVTAEGYEHHPTQDEVQRVRHDQESDSDAKLYESSDPSFKAAWGDPRIEASINASTQKIFGWDTRNKIFRTRRYPWSAMGRVDTGCTGTFIGPRHILTAGHCVYNPYSKKWLRNLNFRRAKSCSPNQGYFYRWKYAITVWGWIRGRRGYDYAVIVVNKPSPSWMSFGWRRPMPRFYVNMAGYPVDKPGQCMWYSHCRLYGRYNRMMSYYCDTYNGMSGAAVYARIGYSRIVYGVHVGVGGRQNRCVRINKTRFRTLHYIKRRFR